jgi:hypothetical protein
MIPIVLVRRPSPTARLFRYLIQSARATTNALELIASVGRNRVHAVSARALAAARRNGAWREWDMTLCFAINLRLTAKAFATGMRR